MGIQLKISNSQFVIFACLLLALLCANMNRAWSFKSVQTSDWGNATSRAPVEYAADDEEFLMESEVNRMILAATKPTLDYKVLGAGQHVCDAKGRYANCQPLKANNYRRPCNVENRCKHYA